VSEGGCAFRLGTTVSTGQVLSIRLPLPRVLRRYDQVKPMYETYALVRSVQLSGGPLRVGVSFLGRVPPRGYADHPGARFLPERRRFRRENRYLKVRLIAEGSAPERTVVENVSREGARVMTALGLAVGDRVRIEDEDGLLQQRGEVRGIHEGKDGIRRVSVRFVD
jgi:hypothetical protein